MSLYGDAFKYSLKHLPYNDGIIAYMKINVNDRIRENIISYTVSGFLIVLFWFLFHSFGTISAFLTKVLKALIPFLLGGVLAMLLMPVRKRTEEFLQTSKMSAGARRKVAVAISMTIFMLMITSFFIILIPQLYDSFRTLIGSLDGYMTSFGKMISNIHLDPEVINYLNSLWGELVTLVRGWVSNVTVILSKIVSYSFNVVSAIFDFFIAIIISFYLLLDTERFTAQMKKLIYAVLAKSSADSLYDVFHLTNKMFNSFVYGKMIDSLIIGIICAVCLSIMRMPYTALISFIVGLTNMIPVFGPFIGAVPCILILLIISPAKALEFGIFVLILQQVDGNIIGPRILGDSLGLPALWVMFAILLGGAMFGIIGMFLGVPLFSVVYFLVSEKVNKILRERRIHVPTETI